MLIYVISTQISQESIEWNDTYDNTLDQQWQQFKHKHNNITVYDIFLHESRSVRIINRVNFIFRLRFCEALHEIELIIEVWEWVLTELWSHDIHHTTIVGDRQICWN